MKLLYLLFVTSFLELTNQYDFSLVGKSKTKKIFLKPRRRIIENFRPFNEAKLKIIFEKGTNDLEVRWFYGDVSTHHLNRAEEPNKLDVEGNSNFKTSTVRSGNVLMNTLTILNLPNNFPIYITALFSYHHTLYQYLLETEIANQIQYQDDILASLIWLSVPQETITISRMGEGDVTIECVTRIETSSPVSIGEVRIYKSELKQNKELKGSADQLKTLGLTKITVDRPDPFDSASGKYTYNSSSVALHRVGFNNTRSMQYQLKTSIKISNASEDDTGVYTCISELANDKVYFSSWVKKAGKTKPVIMFNSCEDNVVVKEGGSRNAYIDDYFNVYGHSSGRHYNNRDDSGRRLFEVHLRREQPSCVRCSVFDSLMEQIRVLKDNVELNHYNNNTYLHHHINVPEGAQSEVTIMFWQPDRNDEGNYRCTVANKKDYDEFVNFEIKIDD